MKELAEFKNGFNKNCFPRWNLTAEYNGKRYFVTSHKNVMLIEKIAFDFIEKYSDVRFFINDIWGSTSINGTMKELRKELKNE